MHHDLNLWTTHLLGYLRKWQQILKIGWLHANLLNYTSWTNAITWLLLYDTWLAVLVPQLLVKVFTFLYVCRAGELTPEELDRVMNVVQNPRSFKVPDWFLNRKKDIKDGRFSQVLSNNLDMKLRDDLERLKKIRLVHYLDRGYRFFMMILLYFISCTCSLPDRVHTVLVFVLFLL